MIAGMRSRTILIGLWAAVCLLASGAAGQQAGQEESWVRYRLPATRTDLTTRWQLLRSEGEKLVIKVDTYLGDELRSSREIKGARLRVPEQHRRETVAAGGRRYDCQVFEVRGTTFWYSEEVPLLGIVRSQTGDHDIMELVESSVRRRK